jgi:hypothetical protein
MFSPARISRTGGRWAIEDSFFDREHRHPTAIKSFMAFPRNDREWLIPNS